MHRQIIRGAFAGGFFCSASDRYADPATDEITGITDGWPEQIKWLRDNDAQFRNDTVVLTGSSASDLTASVKALAGRRGTAGDPDRVLLPMGFRTFMRLVADEPVGTDIGPLRAADLTPRLLTDAAHALAPWLHALVDAWEGYLLAGGFPAAVASYIAAREVAPPLVRGLVDVVHGDAFRRADWSRAQTAAFMRRIAQGLCAPVNISAVADDIGVSSSSVRRRLDELREAFVVWPCYREDALRPKLSAQAKVYFTDPVYARLEVDVPPTQASCPSSNWGSRCGAVLSAIIRAATWASTAFCTIKPRPERRSISSLPHSAAGPSSRSTSTAAGGGTRRR